jgi:hypothetical protein
VIAEGTPTGDPGIRHALAFGVSQSGRLLRHFLELGMNDDGHGRRVFDGVKTFGKAFPQRSRSRCSAESECRNPKRVSLADPRLVL